MTELKMDPDTDQIAEFARLQNDLIISQRQNEIIKVEMDKLRKEKMILEGTLQRTEKLEKIMWTTGLQPNILPPSTSSPLPYPDLLAKYNALLHSHEYLLQARRSDRIAWEALKTQLEGKIHRLRSGRKRTGGSGVKKEDGKVGVEDEKEDFKMDERIQGDQAKVTATTSTIHPPPIPSPKAASPIAPTSKHNTPTKPKTPLHELANLTPAKQPMFDDIEKEEKETQTLPASDHAEYESLHLLQSLTMCEAKEEHKDEDVMMLDPDRKRVETRSSKRCDEHKVVDRSRILVEESQQKIVPPRRDRSATRSKQASTESKLIASKLASGLASKHLMRDDQPRTPIASSGTKPKVAVSDPPRTSIPSHITTISTQKSNSEPRPVRWLGRGVNGVTSTAASATKRPFLRKDSFEDDQPFPARTGEVDTPTNKKARTDATPPLKIALASSPSVDKILHGLQGQEKVKQLKELARKKGPERSKVYAPYKGRGRYSVSKPAEPEEGSSRDMYEIDPSKNNGHAYAYHDVVRKKECRKHLQGEDCEECKNWYRYTSDLPDFNRAPPFRQPITGEMPPENDGERHVQAHKNEVSRHRAAHARNPTPPGFWNMGFPSTPQVAEENAEADRMHQEKQERLRREAERGDGRYRIRH